MCVAMLTQLDADPATPHLVSDSGSRAGTKKGVEDEIARLSRDFYYALH